MCLFSVPLMGVALLVGCNSGGGGDGGTSSATGAVSVAVTDAPIAEEDIAAVCIAFSRLTLHRTDGTNTSIPYDPIPGQVTEETHCLDTGDQPPPVKLDALGGRLSVALADSVEVPAGRYTWVRLHLRSGESYVVDAANLRHDLRCNSCEPTDNNDERGFKLNRGFDVPANGNIALTVDVDLRKSLTLPGSGDTYVLRPTARLLRNEEVGSIAGEVDDGLISSLGGSAYDGTDVDTGCAVYVYPGHDVAPPLDDVHDTTTVLATAAVKYRVDTGTYRYTAAYLPGGTDTAPEPYTVALTCDADDPESDEVLSFTDGQNAEVVAGETYTADFPAPSP